MITQPNQLHTKAKELLAAYPPPPQPRTGEGISGLSSTTPAHKSLEVSINLSSLGRGKESSSAKSKSSSKPERPKRKAVQDPVIEDDTINDEDKDVTYVLDDDD